MGFMNTLNNLTGNAGSAPIALPAFNPPLGIHSTFMAQVPTTLVMKEKAFSLSGDDFSVKDQNGVTVLKVHGKSLSMQDKKDFKDPQGNFLFSLRNKLIAIHKTHVGEKADGTDIFKVASRMALGPGSKMEAKFKNAADGRDITLKLRGSIFDSQAQITLDDRPVAQITRKLMSGREVMTSKQTYYCTCAPGVDLALIAAICVAWDEAENEGK